MQGEILIKQNAKIGKWGTSSGVRIPTDILKEVGIAVNDMISICATSDNEIIIKKKTEEPKEGTLEYLFKDYVGGEFTSELVDMNEPIGAEEWWKDE